MTAFAGLLRWLADSIDPPKQHPTQAERDAARANASGFRPGSKQRIMADVLNDYDNDLERAWEVIWPMVGRDPMVFSQAGAEGERVPLPMGSRVALSGSPTQYGKARKTLEAVRRVNIQSRD